MRWTSISVASLDSRCTPVVVDCLPLWETDMPDAVIHSNRSFHPARRRRRPRLGAAILALVACLCARTASADAVALTGRVTDSHGGVVAGADVRVRRDDGTVSRRTASDATGTFTIAALPSGDYVVEIEKPGFRPDVAIVNVAGAGSATHHVELGAAGVRESVVVTASGLPQSTLETSKAVSVIDAEEITARNAVTLADVVRLTPGVQVRDAGGPGQLGTLRIRGLRSDAAAVLVDGVRLRDAASTQGDITGFFSNLGVVDFDRVEVLRGSASSLYGTSAVGGAINIVTREGGPQRSEGQLEIGSLGHSRVRGTTGGTLGGGRVAYSAGGLHWLVRDGVDGDDRARTAGGQGSVRAQLDAATSLGVRIYGTDDRVQINASPTASGVPAANIPDTTIVDAIAIPTEELERANAGQPFAFGDATFVPGRDDPDNDRASHFLTTAITLRRVESDRASWQASYQRVGTFRRYESGPLGPGFQTSTLSLSEFDGSTDTFEARGHLHPASWLTVTAGYELEREHYGDLQDDNAVVAPLRTTTVDQPDRPGGVRRGAVLGPRSPAADRARRPAAGLPLRDARHRGDRRRSSVRRRRCRQPPARADRGRVGGLPGERRAARRCAAMSATRTGRPRSTSASAAGSSPIRRAARCSTRPTAIRGCAPTAIARSTPASTRRWPAAACRSRPRRSSSTCSR